MKGTYKTWPSQQEAIEAQRQTEADRLKYQSALKDIAELAMVNGAEWAQRRALRGLE